MKIQKVKKINDKEILIITDFKNIKIKINDNNVNNLIKHNKINFQNLEIEIIQKKQKGEQ